MLFEESARAATSTRGSIREALVANEAMSRSPPSTRRPGRNATRPPPANSAETKPASRSAGSRIRPVGRASVGTRLHRKSFRAPLIASSMPLARNDWKSSSRPTRPGRAGVPVEAETRLGDVRVQIEPEEVWLLLVQDLLDGLGRGGEVVHAGPNCCVCRVVPYGRERALV